MPEPATDAVRRAAETLLGAAPIGVVIRVLRDLLDGWEPDHAPPAPPQRAEPVNGNAVAAPIPPTPRAVPATVRTPTTPTADDDEVAAWDRLRVAVRDRLRQDGRRIEDLAPEFAVSPNTLRVSLSTRRLPTHRLRQRLTTWLAQTEAAAPEVATPDAPFRNGAGAGHSNGVGSDHTGA
jgi:hypothetical protein